MLKRTSKVESVSVHTIGSSSILQVGDSENVHSVTNALDVQREKEIFHGNEGNLNNYSIFNRLYPLTSTPKPGSLQTTSLQPIIKIGSIDVLALSSSAILHIGNANHILTDTRVKHIRQLETAKKQNHQKLEEE